MSGFIGNVGGEGGGGTGGVAVGGDLGGISSSPTVTGLQGIPVSSAIPTNNQVLKYDSTDGAWEPGNITLAGDVTGSDQSNTVVKLQGRNISALAPSDGQILTWVNGSSDWRPQSINPNFGSQTISTTGSANLETIYTNTIDTSSSHVLSIGASNASAVTIGKGGLAITIPGNLTVNGTTTTVSSTSLSVEGRIIHSNAVAGIAPTPSNIGGLSVDRGSVDGITARPSAGVYWDESIGSWRFAYNVYADGYTTDGYATLGSGLPIIASGARLSGLSTGIVHSNSSGVLSSSLIVDADVSASAAIDGSKLAAATTTTFGAVKLAGDLGGTGATPSVLKLQGRSVSSTSPSDGQILTWTNATSNWEPKSLGGSLRGTPQAATVVQIDGYSGTGIVPVNATSSNWNSRMTTTQWTPVTTTSNTTTTIATIPIADNAISSIDIIVQGKRASSTDSFRQNFSLDYSRTGGGSPTAGTNPASTPTTIGTGSTWSITNTISGNNLLVRATGAVGVTIQWNVTSQVTIGT